MLVNSTCSITKRLNPEKYLLTWISCNFLELMEIIRSLFNALVF
jgi:hypothetical protein